MKAAITLGLLLTLTVFSCRDKRAHTDLKLSSTTGVSAQQRLDEAIALAKSTHDFRLFATKGRRFTIPGIETKQISTVKKLCGVKFLADSGDVLKNEQDRADRRVNYQFALKFNQVVYTYCLKNSR